MISTFLRLFKNTLSAKDFWHKKYCRFFFFQNIKFMKMGMIVGVFYFSSQPLQMFYMKEYKIPLKITVIYMNLLF